MATKKEVTINSIVNTAIKLFAASGYSATTTSQIAKEAGVSEAIIFKYFKNKENLLIEISKIAMSQIVENISITPFLKNVEESKDYPLKDFLKSIIRERFIFLNKNYELVKLLLIEMQYSKELKKQTQEMVFPKILEVFNYVKQILIKKSGCKEKNAGAMVRIVLGFIESIIFQKYILDVQISDKEIENEVEEILNIIEKGCKL